MFHLPFDLSSGIMFVSGTKDYKPVKIVYTVDTNGEVVRTVMEQPNYLVRFSNDIDKSHYHQERIDSEETMPANINFYEKEVTNAKWPDKYFYLDFDKDELQADTSWANKEKTFKFRLTYTAPVTTEYSRSIDYHIVLSKSESDPDPESPRNSGTITATIKKNTDVSGVDITYELSADHLFNTDIGYINVNWLDSTGTTLTVTNSGNMPKSIFTNNKHTRTYTHIPTDARKVTFTTELYGFTLITQELTIPT